MLSAIFYYFQVHPFPTPASCGARATPMSEMLVYILNLKIHTSDPENDGFNSNADLFLHVLPPPLGCCMCIYKRHQECHYSSQYP